MGRPRAPRRWSIDRMTYNAILREYRRLPGVKQKVKLLLAALPGK